MFSLLFKGTHHFWCQMFLFGPIHSSFSLAQAPRFDHLQKENEALKQKLLKGQEEADGKPRRYEPGRWAKQSADVHGESHTCTDTHTHKHRHTNTEKHRRRQIWGLVDRIWTLRHMCGWGATAEVDMRICSTNTQTRRHANMQTHTHTEAVLVTCWIIVWVPNTVKSLFRAVLCGMKVPFERSTLQNPVLVYSLAQSESTGSDLLVFLTWSIFSRGPAGLNFGFQLQRV